MAKLFRVTTVPISVEKLLGNQLTYMNQFFQVTAISADEDNLKKAADKLGVHCHAIEMTRKITPLADLVSLWKMYRYFKKERPDIVHTHTPKAGLIGMMAAKLAGVKVRLHTVAGLPLMETTGAKRKVLDLVEKFTYSCAVKVYPNSVGLRDFILKEKFCAPDKLKIIGNGSTNGIDTGFFRAELFSEEKNLSLRNELGISRNDFVFIFVGRLVKDKGINELVAAFKKLDRPDVKLLLVGPYETELDPLAPETLREIENNSDIITVGYQKDVRPYFAISDALAFPSYREGFPNVVLQALAMEVPVIVTDINGCNEIVEDGHNGIIVPPKRVEELHSAMEHFLERDFYDRINSEARNSILRYDQKALWEEIHREYNALLDSKG